jgi:hypothetical protein
LGRPLAVSYAPCAAAGAGPPCRCTVTCPLTRQVRCLPPRRGRSTPHPRWSGRARAAGRPPRPIFLPLLNHFGIDPLFLGILVALNLQTSFLTPPMAISAYYLKGVAPANVHLTQIFRGSFPFLMMVMIAMVVLYVFPEIVFAPPQMFYGR